MADVLTPEVDADAIATMLDLLEFCSQPTTDCLLRIESEGGRVWEFGAKQFLLVIRRKRGAQP